MKCNIHGCELEYDVRVIVDEMNNEHHDPILYCPKCREEQINHKGSACVHNFHIICQEGYCSECNLSGGNA